MYIIDCGANGSTLYNSTTDIVTSITHKEVLELYNKLPKGSIVVSEYAHLGCPRQNLSRSQPFTDVELQTFYKNCKNNDITLKLFPQQSTPRACNYSQLPKSDENDPKSIYLLLNDFPEISLMNPPKNFEPNKKYEEGWEFKFETNEILNVARRHKYLDTSDANTQFLKNNIETIISKISDDAKLAFGLTNDARYKRDNKKNGIKAGNINFAKIKLTQLYSIIATLQDYDGKLRIRTSTNKLAGWKFIKRHILCMTPFHLKGGVARSNIYFHGLRHWVSDMASKELDIKKKEILKKRRGGYYNEDGDYIPPFDKDENKYYLIYRRKYCKAIKEIYMVCKEILGVHTVTPR